MSKISFTRNSYARVLSILVAAFLLLGVIPPPAAYAAETIGAETAETETAGTETTETTTAGAITMEATTAGAIILGAKTTGDEFDQLRQRWLDFTIGDSTWDPANPDYALKLKSLEDAAQAGIDLLVADPVSQSRVFSDYPLGQTGSWYDSDKIQFTYNRIQEIATAYATRGTEFYKDAATRDIIIKSLDYMYQNHYNENVNSYQNWFSWCIGNPMSLMATTMIMWDDLTPEQISNYAKPCLKWQTVGAVPRTDTGTNGIWRRKCDLYVGIVTKNAALLQETKDFYPKFLNFVKGGDGFYSDGTHIFHGYHMYNGGYGTGAFRDIVEILYYLRGSQWDVSSCDLSNVYKIAYEGFVPLLANGMMMDMSRGRDITRPGGELKPGQQDMSTLMRLADSSEDEADRAYINGYLKEWLSNDIVNENFNANGTIAEIVMKNMLMGNSNYLPVGSVQSYHQYAVGDKAAYQSEQGFYAGLGMHSTRINNFEIGDSNRKGWNINDGRLYLYTDDIMQNEDAVKATIDWERLPGTTVVRGTGKASQGFGRTGSFAGGVGFNGKFGLSAMFLRDKDSTLDAKKSYFFFDDEIVELGSGITANDSKPTESILENIKLDGENALIVDGASKPTAIGTTEQLVNPKYLWVEGNTSGSNLGVYIPEDITLETQRNSLNGKMSDLGTFNTGLDDILTRNYLTMYKSHGMNPVNDSYAFVLLPNRQQSDTAAYSTNPDVQILKHDENTHAVYEKNLNILGVANFTAQKGTVDAYGIHAYMSVDGIATVMSQESGQTLSLNVADPTQGSNRTVTVTINREASSVISKDPRVNVVQTTPYIQIEINTGGSKGQAIPVVFSMNPLDMPPLPTTAPEKPELQYAIDSNGINVFFDDEGGTSYKLYYGTESGNYTHTADLGSSTASYISNLIDGAVYYFRVDAANIIGTTSSDEIQVVFDDDKPYFTFIDDFNSNELSKAYKLSPASGWSWQSLSDFGSLGDCIKRPSNTTVSELAYAVPGMSGFDLNAWQSGEGGYANKYAAITFYTAETEADVTADNWTQVTPGNIVDQDRTPKFYKDDYTIDGLQNANYLKIKIANKGDAAWAPMLDRLTVRYSKDAAGIIDPTGINSLKTPNIVNVSKTGDIAFTALPSTVRPTQVAKIVWTVQNPSLAEVTGSTVNTVSVRGLAEGTTNLVATYEGTQIATIPLTVQLYRVNLALNKPVTLIVTPTNKTPNSDVKNAVDGDENTRVGYNNISTSPGWITFTVDMGQSFEVTDVNILWEGSHPKTSYSLEYSTDNATWTKITRPEPSTKPVWDNYTFAAPVQARYLRVSANTFLNAYGMSIYEFQVFGNVPPPAIDSIIVTPKSLKFLKGQTAKLTATAAPDTADASTVEWESSDPGIATVDKSTGFVITHSPGEATITVKDTSPTGKNASAACELTVIDSSGGTAIDILVNSIKLNPEDSIWMQPGSTQAITATVLPDNATNKYLTYSSSNTRIASVDKNGLITARANGNAVITAMNSASGIKAELAVRAAEYVDDIEAAKALLESFDFGATRVLTRAEARQYIENILADLATPLNGVTAAIADDDVFTPPADGTESSPTGTAGSYTFKLSLTKGAALPGNIQAAFETTDLNLVITAMDWAPTVNKDALNTAISNAAGLVPTSYTAGTWANVQAKLDTARIVFDNPSATQAEVDTALADLISAINALVYTETTPGGSSGSSSTGGGGSSSDSVPASVGNSVIAPVIIDGKVYNIGTRTVKDDTTLVTVNQTELYKQLATAKTSFVIPVTSSTNKSIAQLLVKNVEDVANKDMTLSVEINDIVYTLPANSVDTRSIMREFGAVNTSEVVFSIKSTASIAAQAETKQIIEKEEGKLILPAMELSITATYNGKTVNVENFKRYVNRRIEITEEQARNITTAVVVEPDGTLRQVPTSIYMKDGKWYAQINSLTNSVYALIYNQRKFSDTTGKWYEKIANEMYSRRIINGAARDVFGGDSDITRAEFAAITVKALGLPMDSAKSVFTDVSANAWYAGTVNTAYEYGLIQGRDNKKFDPMAKITRQEAMLIMQKAAKLTELTSLSRDLNAFTDAGKVSGWAADAARFNVGAGLVAGDQGKLRPTDNITRGEAVTIILNLMRKSKLVDVRS